MEVYPKTRWHVWVYEPVMSTPFWREHGLPHLTDWEALAYAQAEFPAGTKYRIVEVYWTPQIESIKELTKG